MSTTHATREERRQIFALKRAGHTRKAIVEMTGLPMTLIVKAIGPEGAARIDKKLDGGWRHLGTSNGNHDQSRYPR
jgi:hypothetical protein